MKFAVMVGAVTMAGAALAKPVVWYHFNEKDVGTRASGAQSIVNAANPGVMNASPRVLGPNSTTFTDDANWMPKYDHAFSPLVTWRDGESAAHGADNIGFRMATSDGNGAGRAPIVVLSDDARLHLPELTAEMFVRVEPGVTLANQSLICQLRNGTDHTAVTWQFRINTKGTLLFRATNPDKTAIAEETYTCERSMVDGFWHHIAFTCDGAQIRVYADYRLLGTVDLSAKGLTDGLVYPSGSDYTLSIGGCEKTTWGRFQGFIDEFRLSGTALEPKDFLRTIPVSGDADTLVYIPCDTTPAKSGTANVNELLGPDKLAAVPTIMYSGVLPAADADRPGDGVSVRDGLLTSANVTNAAAYLFTANDFAGSSTTGRTARIEINDLVDGTHTFLTNRGLTVEMFVKPAAKVDYNNGTKYVWGVHTGKGIQQMSVRTDGKLTCGLQRDDGSSESHISTAVVRDGKWHHLALVFDAGRKESYLYIDQALEHMWTNMVADATVHTGSYFTNFNFCAAYNGTQATAFRGLVDEIRVTKRALVPREFLTTRPVATLPDVADKKILFYAPLDGNAKAYPLEDSPAGSLGSGLAYTETDRPLEEIAGRTMMGLATTNVAAVAFPGAEKGAKGIVFTDATAVKGAESLTIEFYAKAPQTTQWTPFVRIEGNALCLQVCKGSDGTGNLALMLKTDKDEGTGSAYIQFEGAKLNSVNWHHYAVTLEKKTNEKGETVTEARAYVDRKELSVWDKSGYKSSIVPGALLSVEDCASCIYLGRAKTWAALNGMLDEVRIVEGVLDVEDFMDECPRRGFSFLLR